MKKVVQGGIVKDALKGIGNLLSGLEHLWNNLADDGYNVVDKKPVEVEVEDKKTGKKTKRKGFTIAVKCGDDENPVKFKVRCLNLKGDRYDLRFKFEDGSYEDAENIRESEFGKVITKISQKKYPDLAVEEAIGNKTKRKKDYMDPKNQKKSKKSSDAEDSEGLEEDASASTNVKIALRKVTSATETEIHLVAIKSSQNPKYTADLVNAVVSSDEFINMLTENPTSFEVIENEADYDVEPCDNCEISTSDLCNTYIALLTQAVKTLHDMQYVKHNCSGERMNDVYNLTDSVMWSIQNSVDAISEFMVQDCSSVPNLSSLTIESGELTTFDVMSCMRYMQETLMNYISVLQCYMCNLSKDKQQILEGTVADCSRCANFAIAKYLK